MKQKHFIGITIIISIIPLISLFYIQTPSFVYLSVTLSIIFFLVAHFIFERNKVHGFIHYLFTCVFTGLSIYLSLTNNVITGIGVKIGPTFWLHSGIFLCLSTLMSGTYFFLEKFRKPMPLMDQSTGEINLQLIITNFEDIHKRLEQIEKDISQTDHKTINEEGINSGKKLDVFLGFLLGIVSSVLINVLVSFFMKN